MGKIEAEWRFFEPSEEESNQNERVMCRPAQAYAVLTLVPSAVYDSGVHFHLYSIVPESCYCPLIVLSVTTPGRSTKSSTFNSNDWPDVDRWPNGLNCHDIDDDNVVLIDSCDGVPFPRNLMYKRRGLSILGHFSQLIVLNSHTKYTQWISSRRSSPSRPTFPSMSLSPRLPLMPTLVVATLAPATSRKRLFWTTFVGC